MAWRTAGCAAYGHFPYRFAGYGQRKPFCSMQEPAATAGKQGGRDGKHGIGISCKPFYGGFAIFAALDVATVTVQFIDMLPLRAIYERAFETAVRTAIMNFNRHGIG